MTVTHIKLCHCLPDLDYYTQGVRLEVTAQCTPPNSYTYIH